MSQDGWLFFKAAVVSDFLYQVILKRNKWWVMSLNGLYRQQSGNKPPHNCQTLNILFGGLLGAFPDWINCEFIFNCINQLSFQHYRYFSPHFGGGKSEPHFWHGKLPFFQKSSNSKHWWEFHVKKVNVKPTHHWEWQVIVCWVIILSIRAGFQWPLF